VSEGRRIWRCGRFELQLDGPLVMGIINVTPDSFSDGGDHLEPHDAVAHGLQLIGEGADIIDVGGESTAPGSDETPPAEELARVRPVVARLAEEALPISIDTRHPDVARAAVAAGASVINDISGFRDPHMVAVAAECDAGVVVMHMLGDPRTMQDAPHYTDVVAQVAEFVGASRKRFIGALTGVDEARLRVGGSVAASLFASGRGADVLRVHDVSATVQALTVTAALSR